MGELSEREAVEALSELLGKLRMRLVSTVGKDGMPEKPKEVTEVTNGIPD